MSDKLYLKCFEQLNGQLVEPYRDAYMFKADYDVWLRLSSGEFVWGVKAGYVSNCGSVPKAFQWFLKSYDPDNTAYNAAFFVHDDLYQKKGYGIFSRSECDAICRGMLREAGINRIHASMMDFAVGIGAKSHWGSNEYCNLDSMSYLRAV